MNNVLLFEGNKIEVLDLNGVAYFNPRNVGECLGLTESAVRMAIAKMNKTQVKKLKNPNVTQFGIRKLNNAGENFLTESGVYKLAFRSDKPEADRFTNWVTDKVLPQIRKTGGYIPQSQQMSDAEIMASALMIAQKTIEIKNNDLLQANDKIKTLEPKADYCDMVLQHKGLISTTVIAKDYGMSAIAFNRLLKDLKIQHKIGDQWFLYSQYDSFGYTGSYTAKYEHTDGVEGVSIHTKWTQKGRLFLYKTLKENGYIPSMESLHEDYINGEN